MKTEAEAREQTAALMEARVGAMLAAVDRAPRMSADEAAVMARNMDRILRSQKRAVALGELCATVGLGDGRDPKALFNYRLPDDGAVQRKLIRDARKYVRIARALASMSAVSEPDLLRELFRGTRYVGGNEAAHPDAALDILELIEAVAAWITRTTRISEAFDVATTFGGIATYGRSGEISCHFRGVPHDPLFEIMPSERGYPELSLCYSEDSPSHLLGISKWELRLDDDSLGRLSLREQIMLALAPGSDGRPRPFLVERPVCVVESQGQEYIVQRHSTKHIREGWSFDLSDGRRATFHADELALEWDQIRSTLPNNAADEALLLRESHIDYYVDDIATNYHPLDAAQIRKLSSPNLLPSTFSRSWDDFSFTYQLSFLSRVANGFTESKIAPPDSISDNVRASPGDTELPRTPTGGWIVCDPHSGKRSLPDLMWQLADAYAEAVLLRALIERRLEDRSRLSALSRMRDRE